MLRKLTYSEGLFALQSSGGSSKGFLVGGGGGGRAVLALLDERRKPANPSVRNRPTQQSTSNNINYNGYLQQNSEYLKLLFAIVN